MTDDEMKALCEAATPGPWEKGDHGEVLGGQTDSICMVLQRDDVDNAALIAAAREALPRLLAEKKRLAAVPSNSLHAMTTVLACLGAIEDEMVQANIASILRHAIAQIDRFAPEARGALEHGGE